MEKKIDYEMNSLIDKAIEGDRKSLETLIMSIQDLIFNLSLRMLGTFQDAEDASQEITLKIITHLSSFRKESFFTTWVFRIASNYLKDYKKNMFSKYPLSFEYYENDIKNKEIDEIPDLTQDVEKSILEEELKMSCTNVMLQCLNAESRCIFILGTMFKIDSRVAADILNITPDTYRKRLSRIRKKMVTFIENNCGEFGSGKCKCDKRINYAIKKQRIYIDNLEYTNSLKVEESILKCKDTMEEIEEIADAFSIYKNYSSTQKAKQYVVDFLNSTQFNTITMGERL